MPQAWERTRRPCSIRGRMAHGILAGSGVRGRNLRFMLDMLDKRPTTRCNDPEEREQLSDAFFDMWVTY